MHLAAGLGHPLIVEALLMAPTANVNARTISGVTPLMLAAKRGRVSICLNCSPHSGFLANGGGGGNNAHSITHVSSDNNCIGTCLRPENDMELFLPLFSGISRPRVLWSPCGDLSGCLDLARIVLIP